MHAVEDHMHWISSNPSEVEVLGEGKGTSATLEIARKDTRKIKIVKWRQMESKEKVEGRRDVKWQGSFAF